MIKTFDIDGVALISNNVFKDDRGLFFESFNHEKFEKELNQKVVFVQDNISISKKGVVRGLHFQKPPYAQGKLVQVLKGRVIDVAVDLRVGSKTYGKHVSVELSDATNNMFWVPEGFAHGFAALENDTIFSYKCTNYYNGKSEGVLKWDDVELDIDWKVKSTILSEKDQLSENFSNFVSPFK